MMLPLAQKIERMLVEGPLHIDLSLSERCWGRHKLPLSRRQLAATTLGRLRQV